MHFDNGHWVVTKSWNCIRNAALYATLDHALRRATTINVLTNTQSNTPHQSFSGRPTIYCKNAISCIDMHLTSCLLQLWTVGFHFY